MTTPLETVLAALPDARKAGGCYMAKCPAHNDRVPSLSVSEGNGGRVLLRCFAGCATEKVVAALGLRMADLFPDEPHANGNGAGPQAHANYRRVVKVYPYTDAEGRLLYEVCRYIPKDFRPRRPAKGNAHRDLTELCEAGWLTKERVGREVYYGIASSNSEEE